VAEDFCGLNALPVVQPKIVKELQETQSMDPNQAKSLNGLDLSSFTAGLPMEGAYLPLRQLFDV